MNAFLPQTYLLGLIGLLAIVAVVGGRQFLRVRRDEQSLLKMEQEKVASSKDAGALSAGFCSITQTPLPTGDCDLATGR